MIEITSLEDLTWLAESVEIECKLAAGQDGRGKLPDDFWPTYSAFANTHGGLVVLGVKEKQGRYELRGVPDADRAILQEPRAGLDRRRRPVCRRRFEGRGPDCDHAPLTIYLDHRKHAAGIDRASVCNATIHFFDGHHVSKHWRIEQRSSARQHILGKR